MRCIFYVIIHISYYTLFSSHSSVIAKISTSIFTLKKHTHTHTHWHTHNISKGCVQVLPFLSGFPSCPLDPSYSWKSQSIKYLAYTPTTFIRYILLNINIKIYNSIEVPLQRKVREINKTEVLIWVFCFTSESNGWHARISRTNLRPVLTGVSIKYCQNNIYHSYSVQSCFSYVNLFSSQSSSVDFNKELCP